MTIFKGKNLSYGLATFIWQHIKRPEDIIRWASFFMKLYDDLYHDLATKQLTIQKKVLRLLESLAIPIEQQNEKKLTTLCQRIQIVKKEIIKERNSQKPSNSCQKFTTANVK